jgi:hypothetical protein
MSVGEWSGSLLAWEQELTGLKDRISGIFGRSELRETAAAFLDGLLSGVERKTGWLMAEQAGLERPWRQALLVLQLSLVAFSVVSLSGVVLMTASPERPTENEGEIESRLEKDSGEQIADFRHGRHEIRQ